MGLLARLGFLGREQSTPSNPAAGFRALYAKSSGWYELNSAGVERPVGLAGQIEAYTFAVSGVLVTQTGRSRIYLEGDYVVETIRAAVNTAPTGGSSTVTVDVNKNGTTLYTGGTGRPAIAVSAFSANGNSPAVTNFTAGDYLTVDIDAIGSTVAGSDLTVTIRLRRV